VHWIAPEYTLEGTNPAAIALPPTRGGERQLLPSSAAFDDLAPGPLRVMALLDRKPHQVSVIESASPSDLARERLRQRFLHADVREWRVEVAAE
jgi:hypothetical protein